MKRQKLASTDSTRNGRVALDRQNLAAEIEPTLEELRLRFRRKFGRDPEPDDPLFFDPDSDVPVPLQGEARNEIWERLVDTLLAKGEIEASAAYAINKTGLFVTAETRHLLTAVEKIRWEAALDEYGRVAAATSSKPH